MAFVELKEKVQQPYVGEGVLLDHWIDKVLTNSSIILEIP